MIFALSSTGQVLSRSAASVGRYSNGADKIYILAPYSDASIVRLVFTLPDGTVFSNLTDAVTDTSTPFTASYITQLYGDYGLWEFAVPLKITQQSGTVDVNIMIYFGDKTILTADTSFMVDDAPALGYDELHEMIGIFSPENKDITNDILEALSRLTGLERQNDQKISTLRTDLGNVEGQAEQNKTDIGILKAKTEQNETDIDVLYNISYKNNDSVKIIKDSITPTYRPLNTVLTICKDISDLIVPMSQDSWKIFDYPNASHTTLRTLDGRTFVTDFDASGSAIGMAVLDVDNDFDYSAGFCCSFDLDMCVSGKATYAEALENRFRLYLGDAFTLEISGGGIKVYSSGTWYAHSFDWNGEDFTPRTIEEAKKLNTHYALKYSGGILQVYTLSEGLISFGDTTDIPVDSTMLIGAQLSFTKGWCHTNTGNVVSNFLISKHLQLTDTTVLPLNSRIVFGKIDSLDAQIFHVSQNGSAVAGDSVLFEFSTGETIPNIYLSFYQDQNYPIALNLRPNCHYCINCIYDGGEWIVKTTETPLYERSTAEKVCIDLGYVPAKKEALDAIADGQAKTNKEVTEAINDLSVRVSNLESLSLTYVEDTAISYGKLVPADVGKYALVKRVGGILKKSHNLLNVADATAMAYERVTIDGDVIKIAPASSIYGIQFLNASEIFEVGKTYYFTASPSQSHSEAGFRFNYTDKSKGEICKSGVLTVEKEISSLDYYINWGTGFDTETTISNIQAVEGDVDLPYEPYWEGIREAKVTAIKSVGANLIDLNKIKKQSLEKITIIDNEVHIAACSTIYGIEWTANSNLLEIGKTYYFGANVSRPEKYGYAIKYKDGERIINILNKAFTITKKVDKLLFYVGWGVAYDTETVISDLQIIKGTTAQPYTPYVEHTLPIPETVQAIHGYGWGVNESANNYIDFEKKQFVQSVEKIDLGSLTWSKVLKLQLQQKWLSICLPKPGFDPWS